MSLLCIRRARRPQPPFAWLCALPSALAACSFSLPALPELGGARDAAGTPTLRLLSPSAGSCDVPTNLREVVLSFDQPVRGVAPSTLWIARANQGTPLAAAVSVDDSACPDQPPGSCFAIAPAAPLPPMTALVVSLAAGAIVDAAGSPVAPPAPPLGFATGPGPDTQAPRLLAFTATAADGCLSVIFETDEPAACQLWLGAPATQAQADPLPVLQHQLVQPGAVAPPGATPTEGASEAGVVADAGDAQCALPDAGDDTATCTGPLDAGLPPDASPAGPVYDVRCADLAGNQAMRGPAPLPEVSSLQVVINEVLAHAAGGVDDEFVELYNPGPDVASLGGCSLVGAAGVVSKLPAALLGPRGYALVVGAAYGPACGDAPPDPSALTIRLCGRLFGAGFPRGGGPVELYDAAGLLVSDYPGSIDVSSAAFAGRSVERIAPAGCGIAANFAPNRNGTATPGYKNSVTP